MSTPSMTVAELDKLVSDMFSLKNEIELEEEKISEKRKKLEGMKAQCVLALKEHGRDNYKTPAGTIGITEKWSVNLPQTMDDKKALFNHFKEKGPEILWRYATVNSNALNSYFLAEWEAAKERGEGMGFTLPGLQEPKLFETLSMRKR
jgi:hypothetical protein